MYPKEEAKKNQLVREKEKRMSEWTSRNQLPTEIKHVKTIPIAINEGKIRCVFQLSALKNDRKKNEKKKNNINNNNIDWKESSLEAISMHTRCSLQQRYFNMKIFDVDALVDCFCRFLFIFRYKNPFFPDEISICSCWIRFSSVFHFIFPFLHCVCVCGSLIYWDRSDFCLWILLVLTLKLLRLFIPFVVNI